MALVPFTPVLFCPEDRRRRWRRHRCALGVLAGVGAGSWAKISSPRSFFPSGVRSFHSWISASVRSGLSGSHKIAV